VLSPLVFPLLVTGHRGLRLFTLDQL